ncbi:MAG TPA: divalent metal cation transporter, partial [Ktedonobacteraceae bacterium]
GPSSETVKTLWHPMLNQGNIADYLYLVAAILGSTISPYLLYFYSSGALEEGWSGRSLLLNRMTAVVGMGFGCTGALAVTFLGAIVLQPLHRQVNTLGDIGLAMEKALGHIGLILFAVVLFATCLGAALEVVLGISYNIAQGFGWEWGENKRPREAARFKLVIMLFLVIATTIGMLSGDPLRLALLASTVIALFLPISLSPFLVLMNDPQYLSNKTNGRFTNIAIICILLIAFVVAVISLPLEIITGGG